MRYRTRQTPAIAIKTMFIVLSIWFLSFDWGFVLVRHDLSEEHAHELNHGRAQRDDVERGKQEKDQREHELHTNLGGPFLSSLATLDARRFGMGAQRLRHAGAEPIRLHEHGDKRADIVHLGPAREVLECLD